MSKLNAESTGIGIEDLAPATEMPRFIIRTFAESLLQPKKQWKVSGLGAVGDLVMIVGDSGAAKTTVALDLMFRCALGLPAFETFRVEGPCSTLYCYAEGGSGIPDRLRAAERQLAGDMHHRRFGGIYVTDYVPNLYKSETDPDGVNRFIDTVKSAMIEPPGLVIMDTLIDTGSSGDENSSNDAQAICANAKKIADEFRCLIVLIHHTGKSGDKYGRGSTGFRAKMDCIVFVSKDAGSSPPKGSVRCIKLRDGEPWGPVRFEAVVQGDSIGLRWVPGVQRVVSHEDELLGTMVRQAMGHEAAKSQRELAELTGIASTTISKLLKRLSTGSTPKILVIQKRVVESSGKANRPANHYYLASTTETRTASTHGRGDTD